VVGFKECRAVSATTGVQEMASTGMDVGPSVKIVWESMNVPEER